MVLLKMNFYNLLSYWSLCMMNIPIEMVFSAPTNLHGFDKFGNVSGLM